MLRLGSVEVGAPFVQAALSGYSDYAMRRLARAHGAPFALNEVVVDRLVLQRGKGSRRALAVRDDDHPVGGQLMGAEPVAFGQAAAAMVAAGYDVVDVNFGCPVSRALGRCRGGYLLAEPAAALEIVDRVLEATAGRAPVTLKMRRGLDDSAASEDRFFAILDGAFARGIAAVTVHGRTVRQKYSGGSDWAFLARVKRHLGRRTMLGSGDVLGPYAARAMLAVTGVDGVSVARGAIGNPFVFRQIADLLAGRVPMHPSVAEQRAALEQHWQVLAATEPAERVAGALRRHGIKYARLHPEPLRARDAWVAARDAAGAARVLAEWYSAARFPQPARPLLAADEARLAAELRQSPAAASAG